MKKEDTGYRLEVDGENVIILKDDKVKARVVCGVVSALEAIFVLENMTKKDWLVYEDEKVYLIDREEVKKDEYCEKA